LQRNNWQNTGFNNNSLFEQHSLEYANCPYSDVKRAVFEKPQAQIDFLRLLFL
jgi:hypothetical protein